MAATPVNGTEIILLACGMNSPEMFAVFDCGYVPPLPPTK
jgi:hypothetical protein